MNRLKDFMIESGLMTAMTIGAGIFGLPYVFVESGWFTGLLYLLVLGGLVAFTHALYFGVLHRAGTKDRLLGLSRKYFGRSGFQFGFVAVVGGLLLTLVVYLILGSEFLQLVFPGLDPRMSFALFWVIVSLPLFLAEQRFAKLEFLGVILMTLIIALIYFSADTQGALAKFPATDGENFLLPFSVVLFSLAGWPILEPIYAFWRSRAAKAGIARPITALALGTFFAAMLYFAFVLGIFGSAAAITENTVSGLTNWPDWKLGTLGILGLFAIWTSYVPIGFEIRNSLARDMKLGRVALLLVVLLPPALVLAGLDSFLTAIGLAGGVFLSLQYLLIILVSRKVLTLRGFKKLLAEFVALVFLIGAA